MDFIRRKMRKFGRRFSTRKSAIRSEGDKVLSLHHVKISDRDIYQQSESHSQKSINHLLVTEYKDYRSHELNDVVLEIMGTKKSASIFGRPIHNEIAIRFENIATSGLNNDQRNDLLEAYLPPVNCKLIGAPSLNPDVMKAITDLDRKRDNIILNRQKQISSAISCLGEALTLLLSKDTKDPTVRRLITDSARILCDSQYNDSLTRRNYILSSLKGNLKKQVINTKINDMLFGKEEPQSSKILEKKNNSKVQISTVLRKTSTPRATSPNRNPTSKQRMIHDSHSHKKIHDANDHKIHDLHEHKIHDSHDHKIHDSHDHKVHDSHDHKVHDSYDPKKTQSPSYRKSKRPIKDFIMVPVDKDTSRSTTRSSNQMNRRDSRQRARSPTQSKASTSSSHR